MKIIGTGKYLKITDWDSRGSKEGKTRSLLPDHLWEEKGGDLREGEFCLRGQRRRQ